MFGTIRDILIVAEWTVNHKKTTMMLTLLMEMIQTGMTIETVYSLLGPRKLSIQPNLLFNSRSPVNLKNQNSRKLPIPTNFSLMEKFHNKNKKI